MKDLNYVNIHSVNALDFIIDKADRYTKEKNGIKYIFFASTEKNKEVLTKYIELCDGIKSQIKKTSDKLGKYGKGFMKIEFDSHDNLHLNKILKLHNLTITARSIFYKDNKYYPQIFLDESLYEL